MQTQIHTHPNRTRQRCRWSQYIGFVAAAAISALSARGQGCKPEVFEGEVRQGQAWQRAISPELDLKLEAVPAGWMIRVLPHSSKRPLHDAAELANPPYRSPTPILISTDFAFRAQDAVAWNPRTFRFFTTSAQTAEAEALYQASLRNANDPRAASGLSSLLAAAPEAKLEIIDAEIAGGTANQAAAAATVASHFEQTAHTVRTDLPPSPLGSLFRLRFRITVPAIASSCRQ